MTPDEMTLVLTICLFVAAGAAAWIAVRVIRA